MEKDKQIEAKLDECIHADSPLFKKMFSEPAPMTSALILYRISNQMAAILKELRGNNGNKKGTRK